MAVESAADRLSFLEDWDSALYKGIFTISCIFDAEYLEVSEDIVGVESSGPAALCRTIDVSDAAHGLDFQHNSVDYKIRGVQPTGDGFTLLKLEEV